MLVLIALGTLAYCLGPFRHPPKELVAFLGLWAVALYPLWLW